MKTVVVDVEVVKELKARGHVLIRAGGEVELAEISAAPVVSDCGLVTLCTLLGNCGLNPCVKWTGGKPLVRLRNTDWCEAPGDLVAFLLKLAEGQESSVKLKWEIMQKLQEGSKRPTD